jgi:hypothetical protein
MSVTHKLLILVKFLPWSFRYRAKFDEGASDIELEMTSLNFCLTGFAKITKSALPDCIG